MSILKAMPLETGLDSIRNEMELYASTLVQVWTFLMSSIYESLFIRIEHFIARGQKMYGDEQVFDNGWLVGKSLNLVLDPVIDFLRCND